MSYLNTNARTVTTPSNEKFQPLGRTTTLFGVFMGTVKKVNDIQRMGRLQVHIPEFGSAPEEEAGWITVSYASPFAGATNVNTTSTTDLQSFDKTQTSYGMWMVPPDIGNHVLIMFINGDAARGIWFGVLYDQFMNNMVPGMAASASNYQYPGKVVPVAEYNKWDTKVTQPDRAIKPYEETKFKGLGNQGLLTDTSRGVTNSSARRESPSQVFGILTPGPVIDKNAEPENVRRKGGSSFIMDDAEGSEYVQLTTKSGAQININETNGFVYLINRDGTAWVQMDKDGNVDIFGAKNISMRAQQDVNIRADRNVNIEAGQNIYMKAAKDTKEDITAFTYDVNNVPDIKTIPVWKYVGEGKGEGGNIVMQALNDWHSTTKSNAYLTVLENNLSVAVNNSLAVTTDKGGQDFSSKMGIKMTSNGSFDIASSGDFRLGTTGVISATGPGGILLCSDSGIGLRGQTTFDTPIVAQSLGPVGNPSAPAPAQSAQSATQAEVRAMVEKVNILATWKSTLSYQAWEANKQYNTGSIVIYNGIDYISGRVVPASEIFDLSYWSVFIPVDKFSRNSESINTTITRLPTYEPCPEHESFSFKNITGYKPAQSQADKTYEGSASAGNSVSVPPPTVDTPGANNSTLPTSLADESIVTKDFNTTLFECEIKFHEGVKNKSYPDSGGHIAGGIGHLMRRPDEELQYPVGAPISQSQIQTWYQQDSISAIKGAQELIGIGVWSEMSDVRKRACADLCYNIGKNKMSKFTVFLREVKAGNWNAAGIALRDSVWFTQVGRRGPNLANMIVNNVDPVQYDKVK
jgi:GH24 family phage-related lysozyme (muramidase)